LHTYISIAQQLHSSGRFDCFTLSFAQTRNELHLVRLAINMLAWRSQDSCCGSSLYCYRKYWRPFKVIVILTMQNTP